MLRSRLLRLTYPSRRASMLALAAICAVLLAGPLGTPSSALADPTSTLARPADPVVLTGADIPSLNGIAPGDLVAFKNVSGTWTQIPVQVDERHSIDVGQVSYRGAFPAGFTLLVYSDPLTDTGADPTPTIDTNDEIAFMAKDAGGTPVAFSEPAGVIAGSGLKVTITDPLTAQTGVVYLFRQNGSLNPSAGQQYVTYTWQLVGGGTYLADYDIASGNGLPNNEDSDVVSLYYNDHFSERWIHDELRITTGAASGVDILDRHASKFPGTCTRSEDTFSNGEGGFFVNKSGPVRALRSYFGANSGPMTQREHVFYERKQDIRTFLRVHAIPGIQDFFDYAPAANQMLYYNSLNTTPEAVIDGQDVAPDPDNVALGAFTWELATGPQGSLTQVGAVSTNISGFSYTSMWLDDTTPPSQATCTGDGEAWGVSGVNVPTGIPCTDVSGASGCTYYLNTRRSLYYDAPGVLPSTAATTGAQDAAPLTYAIAPWNSGTGDSDGDGVADATDNCVSVPNAGQENNDRDYTKLTPEKAYDDLTWPKSDLAGDVCDADDDNDGRTDADEAAGALCGAFTTPTHPMMRDTDGDRMLDGAECTLDVPSDPATLNSSPPAECSVPGDVDADGVSDAREKCFYGTSSSSADSDGDLCPDAREIASVNADRNVNAIDLGQVAQAFGSYAVPNFPYLLDFDVTKNGTIDAIDLGQVAQRFGTCA